MSDDELTDEEVLALIERAKKVDDAVRRDAGPFKRGAAKQGQIDCPACGGKGTLFYSRAPSNGHFFVKCETKDCVTYME